MRNQGRLLPFSEMQVMLMLSAGIILIITTSFPANAQITRLFPVKNEIASRALFEDKISNEPYSEKVIYPPPPGVTRPPSTLPEDLTSTTTSVQSVSSTTPSETLITRDEEKVPTESSSSKITRQSGQETQPNVLSSPPIEELVLQSRPSFDIPLVSTKGPEEINIKQSTTDVADLFKINEEPIAPAQSAPMLPIVEQSSTSTFTESTPVKEESSIVPVTTDGPLIKEEIKTTQAVTSDHKETTLGLDTTSSELTTPPRTQLADIETTPAPINAIPKPCTTPIGKNGECKNIRQCPSLVKLLMRQPLLVENKLYLQRSQCGFEDHNVMACCPDNVPAPIVSPKWSLLPKPRFCGSMQENRLYGGPQTEIDSYSWMALLEYNKGENKAEFHCGGALISDRYIVTAAHCVTDLPKNWSLKGVRLGEWDITSTLDCSTFNDFIDCSDPPINVTIDEIIPHKDYSPTSINKLHDIALLRLSMPVNTTDFIQPICLPQLDEDNLHAFDDQSLDMVGWGATFDGALFNNIKQKATGQVIQLNKCRSKYAENNITLEQSQFCVEGRLKNDTCRIDSGGPVISFDTSNRGIGNYYLAGIQSFGLSSCWTGGEGLPVVYTRVGEYLDWILDNIRA
ncbi:serine protease easter-like [Eupeodes corollae]|uniref:serine protease easter-like n=1 Tax=Eupeodes corollae TaxID=290404 RepID=UPI00248FD252|nr:serine protease easter-like [Eupeodes corollae]